MYVCMLSSLFHPLLLLRLRCSEVRVSALTFREKVCVCVFGKEKGVHFCNSAQNKSGKSAVGERKETVAYLVSRKEAVFISRGLHITSTATDPI